MGWKEGNGLGKNQHGEKDCVQIQRREENIGLGKKTLGGPTNWKDDWWNDTYNDSIKKLTIVPEKFRKKIRDDSSSSDSDSSDDSSNSSSPPVPSLGIKKNKKKHIVKKSKKEWF